MRWTREHAFDAEIQAAATRHNVPLALIQATIGIESGFMPGVVNQGDPGSAWGLMQMIPATARALGYDGPMGDLLSRPALAIDLGTQLLAQNLARSGGSVADSVSAYNGGFRPSLGFGAVRPNGLYANQGYVNRVLEAVRYFGGTGGPVPAGGGTPETAASFPPDRRHRVRRVADVSRTQRTFAWLAARFGV